MNPCLGDLYFFRKRTSAAYRGRGPFCVLFDFESMSQSEQIKGDDPWERDVIDDKNGKGSYVKPYQYQKLEISFKHRGEEEPDSQKHQTHAHVEGDDFNDPGNDVWALFRDFLDHRIKAEGDRVKERRSL